MRKNSLDIDDYCDGPSVSSADSINTRQLCLQTRRHFCSRASQCRPRDDAQLKPLSPKRALTWLLTWQTVSQCFHQNFAAPTCMSPLSSPPHVERHSMLIHVRLGRREMSFSLNDIFFWPSMARSSALPMSNTPPAQVCPALPLHSHWVSGLLSRRSCPSPVGILVPEVDFGGPSLQRKETCLNVMKEPQTVSSEVRNLRKSALLGPSHLYNNHLDSCELVSAHVSVTGIGSSVVCLPRMQNSDCTLFWFSSHIGMKSTGFEIVNPLHSS